MNVLRTIAALLVCALAASACSSNGTNSTPIPSNKSTLTGTVTSGSHPVAGATVALYETGQAGTGKGATAIAGAISTSSGSFFIPYAAGSVTGTLYVVATGGNAGKGTNSAIALSALVGPPGSAVPSVTVNERSTVAFAFAFAQFSDATGAVVGTTATNAAGLTNAALLDRERLVAPQTANPASFFPSTAACAKASDVPENCEGLERLNALANALAGCTQSAGPNAAPCSALFAATGVKTKTTLAAAHAIVLDPPLGAAAIYALSLANKTYAPTVASSPAAWTIALKYYGNGKEFDGPGAFAIDAHGNIWVTNNYEYNADPHVPACGSKIVIELTPLGDDAPGAPFSGGGIDGLGWGVTLDKSGDIWLGNFGFQGKGCTVPPKDQSVTQLTAGGSPVSPSTGWQQGPIDRPQGTVADLSGNIWMANFGNGTVTVYRDADPKKSAVYANLGLKQPFGEAIDANNRVWVTGEGSNNVALLNNDGTPVAGSPFSTGVTRPLGDAIDMENDVWISSNGGNALTVFDANGKPILGSPITAGGIRLPWGVAVDGNDNVWAANFSGVRPRVSEICGRRKLCPPGIQPGQAISPSTGYTSISLQRLTSVAIDASGNVWVCDNWRKIPYQTNPGGDGVTEFVGLAGPVAAPMSGVPRRP